MGVSLVNEALLIENFKVVKEHLLIVVPRLDDRCYIFDSLVDLIFFKYLPLLHF